MSELRTNRIISSRSLKLAAGGVSLVALALLAMLAVGVFSNDPVPNDPAPNDPAPAVTLPAPTPRSAVASPSGSPALHAAIAKNDIELVRIIVEGGADVDAKNRFGDPALHQAIAGGDREMVKNPGRSRGQRGRKEHLRRPGPAPRNSEGRRRLGSNFGRGRRQRQHNQRLRRLGPQPGSPRRQPGDGPDFGRCRRQLTIPDGRRARAGAESSPYWTWMDKMAERNTGRGNGATFLKLVATAMVLLTMLACGEATQSPESTSAPPPRYVLTASHQRAPNSWRPAACHRAEHPGADAHAQSNLHTGT